MVNTIPEDEDLTAAQQVALAHSPADVARMLAPVFALDRRCARIVGGTSEPALSQIRLAWWRERLAEPVSVRPKGDAVLDSLSRWSGLEAGLIAMVEAWEMLLADQLSPVEVAEYCEGRAAPVRQWCHAAGLDAHAGDAAACISLWSCADLAAHLGEGEEKRTVVASGKARPSPMLLPKRLRGIAILGELGRRALLRGGDVPMSTRGDALAVLRMSLLGR